MRRHGHFKFSYTVCVHHGTRTPPSVTGVFSSATMRHHGNPYTALSDLGVLLGDLADLGVELKKVFSLPLADRGVTLSP